MSVFLLVLVLAGSATLVVLSRVFGQQQAAGFSMPQTTVLAKMDLELTVTATGTLQSTQAKQVSSELSYDVKEIYVSVGDTVEADQPLCLLDDTELKEAIADLREDIADANAEDEKQLSRLAKTLQEAIDKREKNLNANNATVDTAYNAIEQTRVAAGNKAGNTALEAGATRDAESAANTAVNDAGQNKLAVGGSGSSEIKPNDGVTGVGLETALTAAKQLASDAQIRLNAANASDSNFDALLAEFNRTQALQTTVQQMRDQVYNSAYNAEYQASKSRNHDSVFVPAYNTAYNNADVSAATSTYEKAVETRDTTYENDTRSIETAQQNYDDQAEKDSTETLREQLEEYQDDLKELTVTAPIAGVVMAINAEVGESAGGSGNAASGGTGGTTGAATGASTSASSGNALFTIESANQLEIPVSVAEYDAIGLSKGMSATVTSDAIEDTSWTATVTEVAPKASDGYFTVTVEVTSPVGDLTAGMSATVDIITDSRQDVFAVPFDAVVTNDAGQTVVYALDMQGAGGAQGGFGGLPSGELPEGMTLPEGGSMPSFGAGGGNGAQQADLTENRIEIVVETGFESDYYLEISGEGLEEGMMILSDPLGIGVQNTQTTSGGDGGMGGFGGGMPGGNGGGMPGGDGGGMPPGGGGMPFG